MAADVYTALRAAAAEGLDANARRWHAFAGYLPGDYVEVQALKKGGNNFVAHAPDAGTYVRLLTEVEQSRIKAQGVYVIVNLVRPEVAQRGEVGKWRQMFKGATDDRDIQARLALYVDVDVVRETNTSSTEDEVAEACAVAGRVYTDLVGAIGHYDAVAVGASGNGVALFVALDRLPESPEVHRLVVEVLRSIRALHETRGVKVDAGLADAKRLVPAFGTTKRKGIDDDPARPHRRTGFVAPAVVRRLTLADLQHLSAILLAKAPPRLPAPTPVAPAAAQDEGLELGDLRKRLVELKRKKASSLDLDDAERYRVYAAVLDGTALALSPSEVLSDARDLTSPRSDVPAGRSQTINRAAWMLAYALPGAPWEAVAELLRPAVLATDCDPEGVVHWLGIAEDSYERAAPGALAAHQEREVKRESDQAMREALADLVPKSQAAAQVVSSASVTSSTGPQSVLDMLESFEGSAPAVTQSTGALDDSWVSKLVTTADKKVLSCGKNVQVILAHCPAVRGAVRLNLVTKDIEVRSGRFAGVTSDVLSTALMNWFIEVPEWRIKVKRGEVEDQLLLVARENAYDPIADYLRGLVHDGEPRLDDFFFDYAVARTMSERGVDLADHLRRVASKFLVSAVARALDPGCQVDTMLVLEGVKEGEGKTELLRRLFGEYYTVTRQGLGDKDAQMIPASNWGVELGELSAVKKSENDLLKSYIDTRWDDLRLPYGRRREKFPRRCVFAGTTNNPYWLTPGMGLRRYWPVFIERVHLDLVSRDRDQLWAEAVVRYKARTRWHLTQEERVEADAEASARVEASYVEAKIQQWWCRMAPERRPRTVTLVEVVEDVLKLQGADAVRGRGVQVDVEVAMKRLGFARGAAGGDRKVAAWAASPEMLGAESSTDFLGGVGKSTDDAIGAIADARARK